MTDQLSSAEWTYQDWLSAWNIKVGKAYKCSECGNLIMVVRGGTGTLDPRCHGKPMQPAEPS